MGASQGVGAHAANGARRCLTVFLIVAGLLGQAAHAAPADRILLDQETRIKAVDDREIVYFVDRPSTPAPVPLLVVVDGSGCIGQKRPTIEELFRPDASNGFVYARLRVEKPGVRPEAEDLGQPCSEAFSRHYTIQNRVLDHLRVFQHLKAMAGWWNGEVLLWGWSDGGDIAAQIATYYPGVTRSVFGGMGGGLTMAEQFERILICPESLDAAKRTACREEIRGTFSRMEDYPTWKEHWSGQDNSWRAWSSRLRSRLGNTLVDLRSPFLIVHGALDHDSVPVESARKLVEQLTAAGSTNFTYWEVLGMGHHLGTVPRERAQALEQAMLEWLVEGGKTNPPPLPTP